MENSAAPDNIPRSGAEWVELFVTEMTNATSIDDARSRCMRMLESLEKSITERAGGEAAQSLHKVSSSCMCVCICTCHLYVYQYMCVNVNVM